MANVTSDQMTPVVNARRRPTSEHGKRRVQYFKYVNNSGATIAAGSTIDLCKLPPSAVRVTPHNSRFTNTAAAGASISFGTRAFQSSSSADPTAEDPVAFGPAQSIATAPATPVAIGTAIKIDLFNRNEVVVFATVTAAVIPVGFALEGMIEYIYE